MQGKSEQKTRIMATVWLRRLSRLTEGRQQESPDGAAAEPGTGSRTGNFKASGMLAIEIEMEN